MNIPSNQSEEGKKRIEELDFLKALFILLMITFHLACKRPYSDIDCRGYIRQVVPTSVRSILVSSHSDNLWNALLFCLPMGESQNFFASDNLRNNLLCPFSIRNYLVYMCNVFPCWCSCSSKFTFLSYHIPQVVVVACSLGNLLFLPFNV